MTPEQAELAKAALRRLAGGMCSSCGRRGDRHPDGLVAISVMEANGPGFSLTGSVLAAVAMRCVTCGLFTFYCPTALGLIAPYQPEGTKGGTP